MRFKLRLVNWILINSFPLLSLSLSQPLRTGNHELCAGAVAQSTVGVAEFVRRPNGRPASAAAATVPQGFRGETALVLPEAGVEGIRTGSAQTQVSFVLCLKIFIL